MKKTVMIFLLAALAAAVHANGKAETGVNADELSSGAVSVRINPGPDFIHKFPVFLFFKKDNPPQMVLWAETVGGKYLDTLYITSKTGSQSWLKAPADPQKRQDIRRAESLPVWSWKRGVKADDGLFVPDRDNPMPDSVTHASPKKGFSVSADAANGLTELVLWFEVNHSTDFNETYAADIPAGSRFYNGGKFGSGQPSLVYRAYINLEDPEKSDKVFTLVGTGSADGSDGDIRPDFEGIDSAFEIIESVEVRMGIREDGGVQ